MKTLSLAAAAFACFAPVAAAQTAHLWVDPSAGNDTNTGTRTAPLKTLEKALTGRNFDLVVHALPGTYGPKTNGDFWDTANNKSKKISLNGFKNLKIVGEDRATSIIDFNGIDDVWYGLFGIGGVGTDNIEITNLTFQNVGIATVWGCSPVNTTAGCKNIDIHGNLFIDAGSAFICWGGFDVAFHDNVITSTTATPTFVAIRLRTQYFNAADGDRTYCYNNVIINHHHGISYASRNLALQWICNNVILNGNIGFPGSAPPAHVVLESNIAWNCTTPYSYTVSASNRVVDPLLVDVAKNDFHQKAGSPCFEKGYPVPTALSMRNDYYGNARCSDGDDDRTALPDIGVHEVTDVDLNVTNWGIGKSGIFTNKSSTSFAGPAVFFFAFGKAGIMAPSVGSIGFDPATLLFSLGTSVPGSVPLTVPNDPTLAGLLLYAQSCGLKSVSGGFSWKPSAVLDLEL
ncbi:MAG: DUF1565 domain-containing protein [Planctomycetes bacterium]|nr:DUF1565 domain-containing protein [Planctomycetota bacterium]